MIKTIIFDLGGIFFEVNWEEVNKELVNKVNVPIFPKEGRYEFYLDFALGKISSKEYFDKLLKTVNSSVKRENLKKAYKEAYINNTKINENMLKLAKELHKRYNLICITNTNEFHKKINESRGLFKEFDNVFSSFELGKIKNTKNIFIEVLEKLNLNAEDCIFIDDKEENIEIARSVGVNSILFKYFDQLVNELKNNGI